MGELYQQQAGSLKASQTRQAYSAVTGIIQVTALIDTPDNYDNTTLSHDC